MYFKCMLLFSLLFSILISMAHETSYSERISPKKEIVLEGCDVKCQPALNKFESNFTMIVKLEGISTTEVTCGQKSHEEVLETLHLHLRDGLEATRIRVASLCIPFHYHENLFNNNRNFIVELDVDNIDFSHSPTFLNSLKKLRQLKRLRLVNNDLQEIPEFFFKEYSQLEELFAAGNRLGRSASSSNFHESISLKALKFFNNTLEICQQHLKKLFQLKELHLDNYSSDFLVSNDTFVNMKDLEILNLTRQVNPPYKLRLSPGIFRENRHMKELILRRNSIEGFHPETFANLNQLKTLDLSYNSLNESLMKDYFRNLSKLENLILISNNLQYLPQDMFRGLDNLQTLVLSANNFTILSNKATPFLHIPNVKIVDLFNSRVQQLAPYWFTGLTRLELINLEYNNIETLNYTDLLSLSLSRDSNLLTVNLKGNEINRLYLERCNSAQRKKGSSSAVLEVQMDLSLFDAGVCDKEHITGFLNDPKDGIVLIFEDDGRYSSNIKEENKSPPACSCSCKENFLPCSCEFDPVISTIALDCRARFNEDSFDSSIFKLMISHFDKDANYTFNIDLSNNKIGSDIKDFEWLRDIPVRSLNLSFNNLSASSLISTNWTENFPNLQVLDLRGNNLEEIPSQVLFNKIGEGFATYLEGNQLRCDCSESSWLNQFLASEDRLSIRDFEKLNCYFKDSSSILKLNLSDLKVSNYKSRCNQGWPDTLEWVLAAVVLIVLSISACLLASLFARKEYPQQQKEESNYVCSALSGYGPNSSLTSLILYDAFISYSHKDEKFVIEEIVPGLENPNDGSPTYQLCLHERDW